MILTPVIVKVDGGRFQASLAELPAVITVGVSRPDAEAQLRDALLEYLRSLGAQVAA